MAPFAARLLGSWHPRAPVHDPELRRATWQSSGMAERSPGHSAGSVILVQFLQTISYPTPKYHPFFQQLWPKVIHLVGASAFTTGLHYLQSLQIGLRAAQGVTWASPEPVEVPVRRLRIGKAGTSGCPTGTTSRTATSTA